MAFEQLRSGLAAKITPGPSDIASAKAAILNKLCADHVADLRVLEDEVLRAHSLSPVGDSGFLALSSADQAVYSKWKAAARLALASLQADGLIFPMTAMQPQRNLEVRVTQGNQRGSVSFEEFSILLAQKYRISPKAQEHDSKGFVLHDPDLYLTRINAPNMHVRVSTALKEAVECYRNDLFLAASVLLGSASEGAWIQLATRLRDNANVTVAKENQLRKELDSETPKLEVVQRCVLDTVRSHCKDYLKTAGLKLGQWDNIEQTAILYRRRRNYAIHFQEECLEQLDYATVGLMLLNATDYFNGLYRLISALDSDNGQGTSA